MSTGIIEKIEESRDFIKKQVNFDFEKSTFIVLGSGFKSISEQIVVDYEFDLSSIPHVKTPLVAGHGTSLILGKLAGKNVVVQTGRLHLYEGHDVSEVVYTTRLAKKLGINNAIFTNASGSLNEDIKPGEIAVIKDHINLTGVNALVGTGEAFGPQFVDMLGCYDLELSNSLCAALSLKQGVYVGALGPTYETAAETKMFAQLGGNFVGMSTVQEVIAARQLGMRVVGLSLITNFAAGISLKVDHSEVLDLGFRSRKKASHCLAAVLERL